MKTSFKIAILAATLLGACGGPSSQDANAKKASNDPMKTLEAEYIALAEITKNCGLKDGEACYKLAEHFEKQSEGAGLPDNLKQITLKKMQATYKAACDYGYQPACKKLAD